MQEYSQLIPLDLQRRFSVVPLGKHGNRLMVGVRDALDSTAIEELRAATNCKIICLTVGEDGRGQTHWAGRQNR
jgi:hypothetical protein